jgi:hypothetical protein
MAISPAGGHANISIFETLDNFVGSERRLHGPCEEPRVLCFS